MAHSIRALTNTGYKYYRLTKDFGLLKAGTIFYHDPDDNIYGSIANGCLKLCWTPDGNCYSGLCGGTVILHYNFVYTDCFELINRNASTLGEVLDPGHYRLNVLTNGDWDIRKYGEEQ